MVYAAMHGVDALHRLVFAPACKAGDLPELINESCVDRLID
jgi:hypothetical protein